MLVIRRGQMEALSEYMLESFRKRLAAHLRRRLPAETAGMDDATLEVTVTAGMERARQYDVRSEDDIRRFVECLFTLGPHFDTDPEMAWAGEILTDDGLSGTVKMNRVCERAEQPSRVLTPEEST